MMVKWIFCRYTQSRLDHYLDSALPVRTRRLVARHLDSCPACYQEYTRRRDLQRELRQGLPLVGRGHEPDFDRMWGAIRSELPRSRPRYAQFRYGLVAFVLLLALLVPFTMGNHELSVVPQQPSPQTAASTETPTSTDEARMVSTAIASATEVSSLDGDPAPPTLPEPDLNR